MKPPCLKELKALGNQLQDIVDAKAWGEFQALESQWSKALMEFVEYDEGSLAKENLLYLEELLTLQRSLIEQIEQEKEKTFTELRGLRKNKAGINMYQKQ